MLIEGKHNPALYYAVATQEFTGHGAQSADPPSELGYPIIKGIIKLPVLVESSRCPTLNT